MQGKSVLVMPIKPLSNLVWIVSVLFVLIFSWTSTLYLSAQEIEIQINRQQQDNNNRAPVINQPMPIPQADESSTLTTSTSSGVTVSTDRFNTNNANNNVTTPINSTTNTTNNLNTGTNTTAVNDSNNLIPIVPTLPSTSLEPKPLVNSSSSVKSADSSSSASSTSLQNSADMLTAIQSQQQTVRTGGWSVFLWLMMPLVLLVTYYFAVYRKQKSALKTTEQKIKPRK